MRLSLAIFGSLTLLAPRSEGQDVLSREFTGLYGQVEVGGPYAGAEFHGSQPLPTRISLYDPAANSIDMSRDYWKREESHPVVAAVRIDGAQSVRLGTSPWPYTLSPHRVEFHRQEEGLSWVCRYEFFHALSGLVWTLSCRNQSSTPKRVDLYLHIRTVLRTCQTYAWMDSAWTEFEPSSGTIAVHFDQSQTRRATLLVQNLGEQPKEWTSRATELGPDGGDPHWMISPQPLTGALLGRINQDRPAAAFVYRATLDPSQSLSVVLGILSTRRGTWRETAHRLRAQWKSDVAAYDAIVQRAGATVPATGDTSVDRSAAWARALLETNAHALGGRVVPMPCPAEYNFFFTHDVLLTDLSAVFFDPARVKRDLFTIASLSQGGVIPHAWYWRDDGLKTELCTPDNWNHLWFIETVSRYLRHTLDTEAVSRLMGLVSKSLSEVLLQCKSDSLMYAYRPDWWDIGRREGPRSYITILTIRALRDYLFICSLLGRELPSLADKELLSSGMQRALLRQLWDTGAGYLMNANGQDKDTHVYMGSLLAAVFNLLPPPEARTLLETVGRVLLDPHIGVRTVMPPDFQLDSVRAYFRFPTNEAGNPYFYINGGVWPHANAWYAQALCAQGNAVQARRFFSATMTLDGICSSPMGQPAFYEYRYADPSSAEFGKIDKPSFLWAGGMYLGTLYALMGFSESEWNIRIADGGTASAFDSSRCLLAFGSGAEVQRYGRGARLTAFSADGRDVPSSVLPLDIMKTRGWLIRTGAVEHPYLASINAIVHSCRRDAEGTLVVTFSSFDGHPVTAAIVSPRAPEGILLDGRKIRPVENREESDGAVRTQLEFPGTSRTQTITLTYQKDSR